MSSSRVAFWCGCLFLLGGSLTFGAEPAKEVKVQTVTYNVSDLLLQPGGKTGYDRIDDVIQVIVTTIDPDSWRPHLNNGNTLQEINGTKLEITTTRKQHAEVKDLLEALRRMNDVAVVLECDCFEVERKIYEKEIQPRLPRMVQGNARRQAFPVEDALWELLRKRAADLKSNKVRIANGKEARLLSLRKAFTYVAKPGDAAKNPELVYSTGYQGVTIGARVVVTPDRREVRLRLTQQTAELLDIQQQPAFDPVTGKETNIEIPNLLNRSTAATLQVEDGVSFLMPLSYQTPAAKAKDRIVLLLCRTRVYIAAEEKERGNNDS